ncbi:MAG: hypothetical protein QME60_02610 [Verrucomicrobiota bacterium]|nr:hypothetical protein [Verrucomicrobiota bacterium]
MRITGRWMALALLACVGPASAQAQKLESFEQGIKSSAGVGSAGSRSSGCHGHHLGDHLAAVMIEGLVRGLAYGVAYGGMNSLALVIPQEREFGMPELIRDAGDPVIPFIQFDVQFQDVESGVTAWDYRGEVGLAFLGFSARRTFYRERDSDLDVDTIQYHGLYRMTFGEEFEINMGFGALEVKGEGERVGFSFALPMKLHLHEGIGLEYRPVWSTIDETRIYDNDLAVVLGWRYMFLRAGYRWFWHAEESLSGPPVGLSLRW